MSSRVHVYVENQKKRAEMPDIEQYRRLLQRIHETSGLTELGVAHRTSFDTSYICKILKGQCLPPRDTLLVICFYGYFLEQEQVNRLFEARGFAPLPGGKFH